MKKILSCFIFVFLAMETSLVHACGPDEVCVTAYRSNGNENMWSVNQYSAYLSENASRTRATAENNAPPAANNAPPPPPPPKPPKPDRCARDLVFVEADRATCDTDLAEAMLIQQTVVLIHDEKLKIKHVVLPA